MYVWKNRGYMYMYVVYTLPCVHADMCTQWIRKREYCSQQNADQK